MFCSPAFVLLGAFISFLFHFVGQQLLFDRPDGFHPSHDKTLFIALALISVPVKAKSLCKSKLVFLGSNLLCLITKTSSLGVVLRFLPAFFFPLWCCCTSFGNLFYHPRDSGLVYILTPSNFCLRQLSMLP